MTAVAAVLVANTPCLVGDVVLSDEAGRRIDHAGKISVLAHNVALGWSGQVDRRPTGEGVAYGRPNDESQASRRLPCGQ